MPIVNPMLYKTLRVYKSKAKVEAPFKACPVHMTKRLISGRGQGLFRSNHLIQPFIVIYKQIAGIVMPNPRMWSRFIY